jgi:hypothetical protein
MNVRADIEIRIGEEGAEEGEAERTVVGVSTMNVMDNCMPRENCHPAKTVFSNAI